MALVSPNNGVNSQQNLSDRNARLKKAIERNKKKLAARGDKEKKLKFGATKKKSIPSSINKIPVAPPPPSPPEEEFGSHVDENFEEETPSGGNQEFNFEEVPTSEPLSDEEIPDNDFVIQNDLAGAQMDTSPFSTKVKMEEAKKGESSERVKKLIKYSQKIGWLFVIFLFVRLIFSEGGIYEFQKMEQKISQKEETLKNIKLENKNIIIEMGKIKKDPVYQKWLVREELGVIEKDEFLVLFMKKN